MKRKHFLLLEMTAVVLIFVIGATYMVPRFIEAQNINSPAIFPDEAFRRQIERMVGVQKDERFSRSDVLKIKELDIQFANNPKGIHVFKNLEKLNVTHSGLKELDISGLPNLTELNCSSNLLTKLVLADVPKLQRLECIGNQLTSLDVDQIPMLKSLHCGNNKIASLDLTKNLELTGLYCWENPLTELDITRNHKLQILNAHRCDIGEIDLSQNIDLKVVLLSENQMKTVPNIVHPEKLRMLELEKNGFDCEDWGDIKRYQSIVPIYSYSPQNGINPYECAN